jgi:SAM-dependent methyltransferase
MSLDQEARANGMSSTVHDEVKATSAEPRSTTLDTATRVREPTLVYSKPLLDEVLRPEASCANRDYAPRADELDINPSMFPRYAAPSDLWDWRQMAAVLLGDLTGKELLDYGCGTGEAAVCFAKLGARVTAIDTSEAGVSTLKERAMHHKLDIRALEMRCDPTSFPSASFDRIHGMGILHRVGVEAGLVEVWRLLRSGGVGVFLEPMGNPTIETMRRLLMNDERFIAALTGHQYSTWKEIETSSRYFWHAVAYPYHLLYRLKRFIPRSMYDAVRRFDHGLLSMAPGLRRYAGAVVLRVVK